MGWGPRSRVEAAMRRLNVGVIGVGRMGRVHLQTLCDGLDMDTKPRVCVSWIVDANVTVASELAALYAVKHSTHDVSEMMLHPQHRPDAVWICTPTTQKMEIIRLAARMKVHVFCEKPLAMSVAECNEIESLVAESGIQLVMGHQRRFDAAWRAVRDRIASGSLGKIHYASLISRDPSPPPLQYLLTSGGIAVDMVCHDFDILRFLLGTEVRSVYASGSIQSEHAHTRADFEQAGDVDTVVLILTMEGTGAVVSMQVGRLGSCYDQRVEVLGQRGVARLNNIPTDPVVVESIPSESGAVESVTSSAGGIQPFMQRYLDAYRLETRTFVSCLLAAFDDPSAASCQSLPSVNDAKQALRLALAAQKSMQDNRPVLLTEIVQ